MNIAAVSPLQNDENKHDVFARDASETTSFDTNLVGTGVVISTTWLEMTTIPRCQEAAQPRLSSRRAPGFCTAGALWQTNQVAKSMPRNADLSLDCELIGRSRADELQQNNRQAGDDVVSAGLHGRWECGGQCPAQSRTVHATAQNSCRSKPNCKYDCHYYEFSDALRDNDLKGIALLVTQTACTPRVETGTSHGWGDIRPLN